MGHLVEILTRREHWPFARYHMYSTPQRDYAYRQIRLYGVTDELPSGELPWLASAYIWPFDQSRLIYALNRLRNANEDPGRLTNALNDLLERYECRRLRGQHDGPPVRALRLYENRWHLDPGGDPDAEPERRTLLLEHPRATG